MEKLHSVYFSLDESVRTWFENHKAALTSSTMLLTKLTQKFTRATRKEGADVLLGTRMQWPTDSVMVYAEEMKCLFRLANQEMREGEKVRHAPHERRSPGTPHWLGT